MFGTPTFFDVALLLGVFAVVCWEFLRTSRQK
jgi:hypothetical protein